MDLELTEVYDFMRQNFKGKIYPEIGMRYYCPTGESYWSVTPGGMKEEGAEAKTYDSPLEATEQYKKTVLEIFGKCNSLDTLYFRRKPTLIKCGHETFYVERPYKYTVWSRFLISDKPIIEDFEKFLEDK